MAVLSTSCDVITNEKSRGLSVEQNNLDTCYRNENLRGVTREPGWGYELASTY